MIENQKSNSILYFLLGCIPVRIIIILIAIYINKDYLPYYGVILLGPMLGFLYLYFRNLRYYDFLQKLQFKCDEYKVNLKIIDESYTSKICSFCNKLSTISNERKLNCNCNLHLDRDVNGCINILLKSLDNY